VEASFPWRLPFDLLFFYPLSRQAVVCPIGGSAACVSVRISAHSDCPDPGDESMVASSFLPCKFFLVWGLSFAESFSGFPSSVLKAERFFPLLPGQFPL